VSIVCLGIGPSEVSAEVRRDIAELSTSGLLSESHRGPAVQGELKQTTANLRAAMGVPADYAVLFQPSATAAMELILRNTVRARSFHFVDGAFSGRFASTADQIGIGATVHEHPWDEAGVPEEAEIDDAVELISLAHNETSTGQMWPWEAIRALRERHPAPLLSIDVTSTFGAVAMDWTLADFWFFSVQKCMGLPAGLGVLIASPRAVARARELGPLRQVAGWQDLPGLAERIKVGETVETPNVLGIALLGRQLARWDLARIDAETHAKAACVAQAVPDEAYFIRDAAWRSVTTHNLQFADVAAVKARALEAGFTLGAGYGPLRETCLRVATFPSVTVAQVQKAMAAITAG
jgi:phosphoserine aminotransferase